MLRRVLPADPAAVAVVGLGNVLVGDDAFGPFVARTLHSRYEFTDSVDVLDLGTPGSDLAPHLAGRHAIVVIDTVKRASAPGTIHTFTRAELLARGPTPRSNPHAPSLVDTLFLLELQELAPQEVLLIGVVPARYDTGAPLSGVVRLAVHEVIARVLHELERLGCPPLPRQHPLRPDIWWENHVLTGRALVGAGASADYVRGKEG